MRCRKRARPAPNSHKNLRRRRPNFKNVAKFPRMASMDHAFDARGANFVFSFPKIPFCKSQAVGVAPTRVGTLSSAEKARVRRGDCAIFPPENAQIRFQMFCPSTRNAPQLQPASLWKLSDVAEMLHRVGGACIAENARFRRRNHTKICVDDARICCKIWTTLSARGAQISRFIFRRFRSANRKPSA